MSIKSDSSVGNALSDLPRTGLGDKVDNLIAGVIAFAVFCAGAFILARLVGITITSPQLIATAGLIATASVALFLLLVRRC